MADVKITQLPAALSVNDTDNMVLDDGSSTYRVAADLLKKYMVGNTSISSIGDGTPTGAISNLDGRVTTVVTDAKVLVISMNNISNLSTSVTDARITSDMVVINSVLSNPSAQTGDWTVTTGTGTLTVAGNISGTTNITLYLAKSR